MRGGAWKGRSLRERCKQASASSTSPAALRGLRPESRSKTVMIAAHLNRLICRRDLYRSCLVPPSPDRISNEWIFHELAAYDVQAGPPAARDVAWRDDERRRADARRGRRERLSRHRAVRRQRDHGISGEGF